MRRWLVLLLAPVLALAAGVPRANAAGDVIRPPVIITPGIPVPTETPVAFGAIANRYTNVDPSTVFDLNGDLVGDVQISSTTVSGRNGTRVRLVTPAALNLDTVNTVPTLGYTATADLQLSRVYLAQIPGGGYAKFMVLQASPKVTIWFHFGLPTTSVLQADGKDSHAVLTWDPLPDAAVGYNVYRYEVDGNSYTVTQLNDFTVQGTTFTDETAKNRYYLWVVQAVKANGSPGATTTVAPATVQPKAYNLKISLTPPGAKLNDVNVVLATNPVIKHGRLMVPASLLTQTGTKVTVNAETGGVTLVRRMESTTYTVVMSVESTEYTWNGTKYETDVQPYMQGAEVMVPIRTVAPILGLGLTFNSADMTATLQWYE